MSTPVHIKAQFVRSLPSEGIYRVQLDIIDVINIDFDVLVFSTEHDTFSHVATVYDMETYPATRVAAQAANLAYYRWRGATLNFIRLQDATDFESITRNRLKLLADKWSSIVDDFSGTSIAIIDSTT
jgi:hypothetical protein